MSDVGKMLVFEVDEFRCALPLKHVQKIEVAVALTPIPSAPEVVAGIINVRGKLFPVMDVRQRLKLQTCDMRLEDHIILAETSKREMALWVGAVFGIEEHSLASQDDLHNILESLSYLSGITALGDNLILIHDLEEFLSDDEEIQLTQAMDFEVDEF